jgi:hypothetical protein
MYGTVIRSRSVRGNSIVVRPAGSSAIGSVTRALRPDEREDACGPWVSILDRVVDSSSSGPSRAQPALPRYIQIVEQRGTGPLGVPADEKNYIEALGKSGHRLDPEANPEFVDNRTVFNNSRGAWPKACSTVARNSSANAVAFSIRSAMVACGRWLPQRWRRHHSPMNNRRPAIAPVPH